MISKTQSCFSSLGHRDQRTIAKYLEKYSEPESRWQADQLEKISKNYWEYVVTIPACGEDEFLPGALDSINRSQAVRRHTSVLCIIVLNGNEAREDEFRLANRNTRDWFSEHCTVLVAKLNTKNTCTQTLLHWQGIDILLVDRSQANFLIPANQGVGLVRKIGADIALYLIATGKIKTPWIHTTDADARVPDDYFFQAVKPSDINENSTALPACYIYPYEHIPDENMSKQEHDRYWPAVAKYELWLRYYVAGLKWAGSRYAYPAVGSLLASNALAYAKIRGFPKRMAGEDFYFQNKLSKVGEMELLDGKPIQLLTRPSTRVPFGTGQGTIKIEKINDSGKPYEVYNPKVFDFLKEFLSAVNYWLQNPDVDNSKRQEQFFSSVEKSMSTSKLNATANKIWLQNMLDDLDLYSNLSAAEKRSKSIEGAVSQFDDWFDGFKTLKLIHSFRDDLFGKLPIFDALLYSEFLQKARVEARRSPMDTLVWLRILRSITN